jgi:hypothetical protein
LITNGEGEFDQDIPTLSNNFRTKCDQLLEAYNGSQRIMVLIKNVTTTSKGDLISKGTTLHNFNKGCS